MSIRKPCINIPTATYTGKEQSPLRFGLSAEGYDRYTTMEGFDKLKWMVEIKNNKKVWVRKCVNEKITHEEPIIKSNIENNIVIPTNENNKKITDYNIYLSYRLKQLKDENKNNEIQNKELFNIVMSEWKNIKNFPDKLKEFINNAKQDPLFTSITSSKKKKEKEEKKQIMSSIVVEKTLEPIIEKPVEPIIEKTEEHVEPIIEKMVEPIIEKMVEPIIEKTEEQVEHVVEPIIEKPIEPVIKKRGRKSKKDL
jgi:hypothetical protein